MRIRWLQPFRRWRWAESLAILLDELAVLLEQGHSLPQAVEMLAGEGCPRERRDLLRKIFREAVAGGEPLSRALERYLPPPIPARLRLGEATGEMIPALRLAATDLNGMFQRRQEAQRRLRYPGTLIGTGLAVLYFMVRTVIPTFSKVFHQLKVGLPLPTRVLLGFSEFLRDHGNDLVVVFILLHACFWVPWIRELLLMRILPGARGRRYNSLSQACEGLGSCLEQGMGLPDALRLAGEASGSRWYRRMFRSLAGQVEAGEGWDRPARWARLIPADLSSLLRVKGLTPDSCRDVARLLRARGTIQEMVAMNVAVGFLYVGFVLFTAFLVVSMYLPFFQVVDMMRASL